MFLSIPFVAVLKIIFDRIDELKPWGKLLGEKMPANVPRRVVNPEEQNDTKEQREEQHEQPESGE